MVLIILLDVSMPISGQNYQAYNGQELSSLCQPRLSVVNMILPAFATDYCAAAAEHTCTCYAAPTGIWPSWCHCHSLSLASVKSRLVLPFRYRLTRDEGPLNVCVCAGHSPANPPHAAVGQIDRQKLNCFIDSALHTMQAESKTKQAIAYATGIWQNMQDKWLTKINRVHFRQIKSN